MRNSIAHGRQVAIRTSLLQFGATVIAALIAAIFGWRTGVATFAGGAIIVVGNGLFALRPVLGQFLLAGADSIRRSGELVRGLEPQQQCHA